MAKIIFTYRNGDTHTKVIKDFKTVTNLNFRGSSRKPTGDLGTSKMPWEWDHKDIANLIASGKSTDPMDYLFPQKSASEENKEIIAVDLTEISKCKSLEFLDLAQNNLSSIDLTPLQKCEEFKELVLFSNNLTEIDLEPLKDHIEMETIMLDGNKIRKIDVSCLENLKVVDLFVDSNVKLVNKPKGFKTKEKIQSKIIYSFNI